MRVAINPKPTILYNMRSKIVHRCIGITSPLIEVEKDIHHKDDTNHFSHIEKEQECTYTYTHTHTYKSNCCESDDAKIQRFVQSHVIDVPASKKCGGIR
jgi:hypothetical protein